MLLDMEIRIGIPICHLKLLHSTKWENMILGIGSGSLELHGQLMVHIKTHYFVGLLLTEKKHLFTAYITNMPLSRIKYQYQDLWQVVA